MKKLISIFISNLILILCLFGCGKSNVEENTTIVTNISSTANQQTTVSDSTQSIQEDVGGGDILPDKYRLCYYHVPYKFTLLIDEEEYNKWKEEIYLVYPNDTNQMIIKRFIQDFNISREVFDKINNEDALDIMNNSGEVPVMNPKDFIDQEPWEVFNSDIIYTFDDEIINAYYLSHSYPYELEDEYVDAVLSGTYRTQTTDFYFPELDSHSSFSLRGYEYPEDSTTVATLSTTENLTEKTTEKEEATAAPIEAITE